MKIVKDFDEFLNESEELEQYRVLVVNQLKSSGIGKKVKSAA